MVQSAQNRAADDIPGPLNAARKRGILVQRQMSARGVVVMFVRKQNVAQMAFAKHHDMINESMNSLRIEPINRSA
jgi:hypothetical protein